jgi:hypothetical protein
MFEVVPTFELEGVPLNAPVVVLKLAHDGLLEMEKLSVSPLASLAVGLKLYACPTDADVAGVPLIFGALLVLVEDFAVIENVGKYVVRHESFTPIRMLLHVPAVVGVPRKRPVEVENVAHDGLLEITNVTGSSSGS